MSKNNAGLTHEQLLKEFVKAATSHEELTDDEKKEPHTWTSPEIQNEYGVSRRKARGILNELTIKGVLHPQHIWRINDWGIKTHIKGYKLTDDFIDKIELENNNEKD